MLTALGVPVQGLISGSARKPPHALKRQLVAAGLAEAGLGPDPAAQAVVAAVGDPFQVLTAGLLVGAADGSQPLLLAGGSQMAAVLALALAASSEDARKRLSERVMLGTAAWLAEERFPGEDRPPLDRLIDALAARYGVGTVALSSGVRFHDSCHQQLRDYEHGFVKEGVGAGGLLLPAQLQEHQFCRSSGQLRRGDASATGATRNLKANDTSLHRLQKVSAGGVCCSCSEVPVWRRWLVAEQLQRRRGTGGKGRNPRPWREALPSPWRFLPTSSMDLWADAELEQPDLLALSDGWLNRIPTRSAAGSRGGPSSEEARREPVHISVPLSRPNAPPRFCR